MTIKDARADRARLRKENNALYIEALRRAGTLALWSRALVGGYDPSGFLVQPANVHNITHHAAQVREALDAYDAAVLAFDRDEPESEDK